MTANEAIEAMYLGKTLKSDKGIAGNNNSKFKMGEAGVIVETYKEGRSNKTALFSWRRFKTLGSDVNFTEII